jgi:hypothetical protein
MLFSDWSAPRNHIFGKRKGFTAHLVRFCCSRHTRDLFAIALGTLAAAFFAPGVALYIVAHWWKASSPAFPGVLQLILNGAPADMVPVELQVALFTVAAGVIGWAYQSANTRFGVVDIFAAEIATLCRVAVVSDFMPKYVALFQKEREFPKGEARRDYLAVFNNNAKDLEVLDGDVARFVTQFYVHMKALMDTVSRGADPQENPQAALNVIYTAFLAFESARQALAVLTDNERERQEYVLTALLSEVPAYLLLLTEANNLDEPGKHKLRKNRIEERVRRYQRLMSEIGGSTLKQPSREFSLQILDMWHERFPPQKAEVLAHQEPPPHAPPTAGASAIAVTH